MLHFLPVYHAATSPVDHGSIFLLLAYAFIGVLALNGLVLAWLCVVYRRSLGLERRAEGEGLLWLARDEDDRRAVARVAERREEDWRGEDARRRRVG